MKVCSKCRVEKVLSSFHKDSNGYLGHKASCKNCKQLYNQVRYSKDSEKYISYTRGYYKQNRDVIIEKKVEYNKTYVKERRKNPFIRLRHNLRSRTSLAFKHMGFTKNSKTSEMLGSEWLSVRINIENKFTKGMNWDNYGEWHVDHIMPLASAKNEQELMKLCHYTNLQPLWAVDNIKKGSKIIKLPTELDKHNPRVEIIIKEI